MWIYRPQCIDKVWRESPSSSTSLLGRKTFSLVLLCYERGVFYVGLSVPSSFIYLCLCMDSWQWVQVSSKIIPTAKFRKTMFKSNTTRIIIPLVSLLHYERGVLFLCATYLLFLFVYETHNSEWKLVVEIL